MFIYFTFTSLTPIVLLGTFTSQKAVPRGLNSKSTGSLVKLEDSLFFHQVYDFLNLSSLKKFPVKVNPYVLAIKSMILLSLIAGNNSV